MTDTRPQFRTRSSVDTSQRTRRAYIRERRRSQRVGDCSHTYQGRRRRRRCPRGVQGSPAPSAHPPPARDRFAAVLGSGLRATLVRTPRGSKRRGAIGRARGSAPLGCRGRLRPRARGLRGRCLGHRSLPSRPASVTGSGRTHVGRASSGCLGPDFGRVPVSTVGGNGARKRLLVNDGERESPRREGHARRVRRR